MTEADVVGRRPAKHRGQAAPGIVAGPQPEGSGGSARDGTQRAALPVHPAPPRPSAPFILRVDGLVRQALALRPAELLAWPQQDVADDFRCVEGWTVPQLAWQGVPLRTVLATAGVQAEARWLQASAGAFSVPLPIELAATALLALRLGQEELPWEHGGPFRLVVPGQACFTSVKWLDHLELRATPAPNTAEGTALTRLARTTGITDHSTDRPAAGR